MEYNILVAIIVPKIINKNIATNDLLFNLGSPQIPCPLVHPFAIFAPNPTKKPDKINPGRDKSPTNFEVVSKNVGESMVFGFTEGLKKHFKKEDMNSIPIIKEKL